MDFNQFRKELEEKMIEKTKDMPGSIQFQMVQKNGGPKHGIIFTPEGSSVGMTMYAEDGFKHYQEGNSIDKIAEDMAASMAAHSNDLSEWSNIEELFVPENIFPVLVPAKGNEGLLEEIPHIPFENLQVIFKFDLQSFVGGGTANVTNHYMKKQGWDEQKLMEIAMTNPIYRNQIKITPMEHLLFGPPDGAAMDDLSNIREYEAPMVIVSNAARSYGASAILDQEAMGRISDAFQEDFYILPSSVHECIAVPKSEQPLEELQAMVQEVNRMAVAPEAWLSDDVYQFDSSARKITMAGIERDRDERQAQRQDGPKR